METPFRRVFAPKDLWRGSARWAWAWSVLSTTALCGLLFGCYLLLDLLINRGEVEFRKEADRESYQALFDTALPDNEFAAAENEKKPANVELTSSTRLYDQGLRATAWSTRRMPWGGTVASVVRHVGTLQSTSSALLTLLAGNILLALLASVSMMQVKTLAFRTSQEVATRLRQSLHRQTLRLGPSDLQDDAGEVAFLMFTGDVERVREGIQGWFERIVRAPLFLAGLFFVVLMTHWLLALQCLVPLVACWYLIRHERLRFDQSKRQLEDRVGVDLKLLAEGLRKTRLVRGFGMENFEHERFQGHLNRFLHKVASLRADERLSRWLCWMVVVLTLAITLFLIGTKALTDPMDPAHLPVSAIVMFVLAFRLSYRPANEIWDLPRIEESAGKWADSILRYLSQIPEVGQAVGAKFLQPLSKQIQFESVTYRLPDGRLVLDRVDLRLPAGKVIAVISLDPCEARALTYMLPRFIEPQAGRVLIDGEDLAFVTLESLRAEAIYVGGTDPFFTGTVTENLSCGDPRFTLQYVTEAAKLVHAQNFISKLPQGYETLLGEYGEQLDAGQSYRLGLARALLRDPALMIIEEPAERLDEDTKSLLDDTYARLAKGRTLIFLPSRLSTVRKADHVIFLHKGRIEAIGNYSKLITSSPLLRHWEYVRFNEFSRESDAAE